MAWKILLAWRKEAYETWVSSRPFRIGGETWILPDNVAKQLSQKFSRVRTAETVAAIASSCNWKPLGGNAWFGKVAEVLGKLNNEIDARRGSGSQTTAASALDQTEDGSDGDGEESHGEEDLPESESDPLTAARVIDQQSLGNQLPAAD